MEDRIVEIAFTEYIFNLYSLLPWQLNISFIECWVELSQVWSHWLIISLCTFNMYCKCPSFAWQSAATHTHTQRNTSGIYTHTCTYIHTVVHTFTHTWQKRTWQTGLGKAVNAPKARINYNFRFFCQSRQIRQADWLMDGWMDEWMDWPNDWRPDWLTCVEFDLKVTFWWPHKRKVRNCQLGNQRERDICR